VAATSKPPTATPADEVPARMTPPSTTTQMPRPARRPMYSWRNTRAMIAVATSSRFKNNETVPAGVRSSARTRSTGASPPPKPTATNNRTRWRPVVDVRGSRSAIGATAIAAPRYSRPARATLPTLSTTSFVAGVAAPNSTAASAHQSHPLRWLARLRVVGTCVDIGEEPRKPHRVTRARSLEPWNSRQA